MSRKRSRLPRKSKRKNDKVQQMGNKKIVAKPAENSAVNEEAIGLDLFPREKTIVSIEQDIASHNYKSALNNAKLLHEKEGTAESEALVLEAYIGRIRNLQDESLLVEARELLALIEDRYPSARERLWEVRLEQAVREGDYGVIGSFWNDTQLSEKQRRCLEDVIRREIWDLPSLAACRSLADNHPLRREAAALAEAFETVIKQQVDDDAVFLSQIPRRSPLAPWKLLIRAIACFYRGEDEQCADLLERVDPGSAAGVLLPVLRAMLANDSRELSDKQESTLFEAVLKECGLLQSSLAMLEEQFAVHNQRKILREIKRAVKLCRKERPDLLETLKQHISIRCMLEDIPVRKVVIAMGGPSLHNASFWRLMARAWEDKCGDITTMVLFWEEFRRHAVHEGWFAAWSKEEAVVYRHMLDLIKRLGDDCLVDERRAHVEQFNGFNEYYKNQPPELRSVGQKQPMSSEDIYFLYPERLYERIIRCDKDADIYKGWIDCLKKQESDYRYRDDVASRWHKDFPDDYRPLLCLMESAEQRGAFTKALKFLEQAEELSAFDPAVTRARLRLNVSKAIKHLKQRKPHLVEKDLSEIEDLPAVKEGDRQAFLAAIRNINSTIKEDRELATQYYDQVNDLLGSEWAGLIVFQGICLEGRLTEDYCPPLPPAVLANKVGDLAEGVGRGLLLCRDMGVPWRIPLCWAEAIDKNLSKKGDRIDAAKLCILAEAALYDCCYKMAFTATRFGLQLGGPMRAKFLFLRGLSLQGYFSRREECLAAAAELARRQGDMELVGRIIDAKDQYYNYGSGVIDVQNVLSFSDAKLDEVLERELKAKSLPSRTHRVGNWTEWDEDDDDDEYIWADADDSDDEESGESANNIVKDKLLKLLLLDMPPEIQKCLLDILSATNCDTDETRDFKKVSEDNARCSDKMMVIQKWLEALDNIPLKEFVQDLLPGTKSRDR